MGYFFTGCLFLYLNFNINIGNAAIGLLPDFVGYFLILRGLEQLLQESPSFLKAKKLAFCLGIFSLVLYVLDLTGMQMNFSSVLLAANLVISGFSYYMLYLFIIGVQDMEAMHETDFGSRPLRSGWILLLIFHTAALVLLFVPALAILSGALLLCSVVYFLVAVYRTKKLYAGCLG